MHHLVVIKIEETEPDSKKVNHHHYYMRMENAKSNKIHIKILPKLTSLNIDQNVDPFDCTKFTIHAVTTFVTKEIFFFL
jgi:hypothetical protein